MTLHHKVGAHHLRRAAYLYIRQSTMRQVLECCFPLYLVGSPSDLTALFG